jgi:hypothetical protein
MRDGWRTNERSNGLAHHRRRNGGMTGHETTCDTEAAVGQNIK